MNQRNMMPVVGQRFGQPLFRSFPETPARSDQDCRFWFQRVPETLRAAARQHHLRVDRQRTPAGQVDELVYQVRVYQRRASERHRVGQGMHRQQHQAGVKRGRKSRRALHYGFRDGPFRKWDHDLDGAALAASFNRRRVDLQFAVRKHPSLAYAAPHKEVVKKGSGMN